MKKLFLLLMLAASAFGQTTTSVSGTVKDLSNAAVTSGQVSFTLQPGIDTTMSGISRFTPTEIDCSITGTGAVKALDGVSTCTVVNNTALQPSGTSYKVCLQPQFVSPGSCFVWYATGGSVDITQQVPTPPLTPAYNLVDTFSNQNISGSKTFLGNVTYSGGLTFGPLTLSGALTANNGGSLGGTFSGNPTFSGNVAIGGNVSVGGTLGATLCLNIDGVVCADGQTGSDMGAKVNAAFAACIVKPCTVFIGVPGSYTYTTDILLPSPTALECANGVILNYTGTGKAVKLGPDSLTVLTYSSNPYSVQGCTFTGGANMAFGIYVNLFVVQSFIFNNYFHNFGNINAWNVWYQGENWDGRFLTNYMWVDQAVNQPYNGIFTNAADPANGAGGDFGQSQITINNSHIQNGGTNQTGIGVYLNGLGAKMTDDNIADFSPNIRLGAYANETTMIHVYGEVATGANPCIQFGDATGPRTANFIDGFTIQDSYCNVHNPDFSTTAHFIGPTTASSVIRNSRVLDNEIAALTAGQPLVVQNNVVGQVNNYASRNRSQTDNAIPHMTSMVGNIHTVGGNINSWLGEDELLTAFGSLQINGGGTVPVIAGAKAPLFINDPNDEETDIIIQSGATTGQDHFIQFLDNTGALIAKIGCASAGHGGRCTIAPGGVTAFQADSTTIYAPKQIQSSVTTGTAPITIASTTTVPNLTVSNHPKVQFCGTTTTCAATAEVTDQIVYGSAPLVSGTPSTATITGISPAFTSSSTYVCTVTEATNAANNLLKVANVSGSSFTITGPNTLTDVINYHCVGH